MPAEKSLRTALIAAVARNGVIGIDNTLPWHLPEDLQYFKRVTMGKPLIMGRLTFDSIGRPLPGRANIVVTRQSQWAHPGVITAASVEDAIKKARKIAGSDGVEEIIIMGGAQIYRAAMSYADRLYLTEVESEVNGDAYFPSWDKGKFYEISRLEKDFAGLHYAFVVYDCKVNAPDAKTPDHGRVTNLHK